MSRRAPRRVEGSIPRGLLGLCCAGLLGLLPGPARVHAQSEFLGDPVASRPIGGAPDETEARAAAARSSCRPRGYPGALASRPLTLDAGRARMGHGTMLRLDTPGGTIAFPFWVAIGVTDDVELGVTYPLPWDPSAYVVGRVLCEESVEIGLAGVVTAPLATEGNTVLRASMPVLFRPFSWARIDTGLWIELLVTPSQVSPEIGVPLTLTLQPADGLFFGVEGAVTATDGSGLGYTAYAGPFLGGTVSSPLGPIFEGRVAGHAFGSRGFDLTVGFSFYPRF